MTTKQKTEMYERIEAHGAVLNAIFETAYGNIELCKKLRHIEAVASRGAVDYCIGDIDSNAWDKVKDTTRAKLDKLLSYKRLCVPVWINGDPRGYALKIDDEWTTTYNNTHTPLLYRDWGGYGILAPDFCPQ